MSRALSAAEVLALPAAVDIVTAGRACGISRTTSYELARRGEFPVPLLRLGNQYRVRRSDLLDVLGIQDRVTAPAEPATV
ncbi:helix-turn-helix domain-containing protein [Streptomyces sp. NPDC056821]|uniref:helix-turn-helix domain-containing protein n=1 Tax=unclassified Streptomyces TaxID=2593676 RepID=UPI00368F3205